MIAYTCGLETPVAKRVRAVLRLCEGMGGGGLCHLGKVSSERRVFLAHALSKRRFAVFGRAIGVTVLSAWQRAKI